MNANLSRLRATSRSKVEAEAASDTPRTNRFSTALRICRGALRTGLNFGALSCPQGHPQQADPRNEPSRFALSRFVYRRASRSGFRPAILKPALSLGASLLIAPLVVADAGAALNTDVQRIDVTELLQTLRDKHDLSALGAAVVRSNQLVALEVVGLRALGETNEVTVNDRWHHGSLTKSMTATLAGRMVDEELIEWTTTVGEVFPELVESMADGWSGATLEQLLANRGGAPGDLKPDGLWSRIWNHGGSPREQRLFLLREVTAKPPIAPPGTKEEYSNAGFAIAGAMLEERADTPWEELITEKVFQPLGMTTAGFGAPGTVDATDQPRGHRSGWFRKTAVPPGPRADNPAAIGPAGTVHCSLEDFARYLAFHLAGMRGEGELLKSETFEKLYADVADQGYALGWVVTERDWAGGRAYHHTGSNTMWYTNVWIAPEKNFALVVVTNLGGDEAFKATDEVIVRLLEKLAGESPTAR